jgi:ornithine cyclodeaminase
VAPGAHVNAVGACVPVTRELDGPLVARARLYVDSRESALAEAGDFVLARKEGLVTDEHILGTIGELLLGTVEGRTSDEDVTLFESLGIAVEDLAAAHYIYAKARGAGGGTQVAIGGERHVDG